MLVSWNWLKQYVTLDMPAEELARRLMMAGLNHESTEAVGSDLAIDLEVTSNRPDCLGHLGVAREISVLWNRTLKLPEARPREGQTKVETLASVRIDAPALCPRYTARVIRGAKIGPSPAWLRDRLFTIFAPKAGAKGWKPVNNVVDITNYVLMECGQPLHAFDLNELRGRQIIVREARKGEKLAAIDHKSYELAAGMCVIADAERPVALAGVMGGADSEVAERTTDLLIESAVFDPLSVRNTSRALNLASDSSYRFERVLDPLGVDWASRRACELILELAGGELAAGVIDVGAQPGERAPIVLRFSQLKRILGIDIDPAEARRILTALGNQELSANAERVEVIPPSWRRDLSREIDLVEEVARIHGYDAIPEDVSVPMATSHRTLEDRVLGKVRQVLTAAGFDEAMTLSVVESAWSEAFSPWTSKPPLKSSMPVMRRADTLRRSLVPSLLGARRTNETLSNPRIELFEIAKVYLPSAVAGQLPTEDLMLAVTSGGDYFAVKGLVEALLEAVNPAAQLAVRPTTQDLFDPQQSCELRISSGDIADEVLGYLGVASPAGLKRFELRGGTTVAEINLSLLFRAARLAPQYVEQSAYPAVARDLNLVVDESVLWDDVARTVRDTAAPYAERLDYKDTYRDAERLGPGKKSLLLTLTLRSPQDTLTGEAADALRDRVVAACQSRHGAQLRA